MSGLLCVIPSAMSAQTPDQPTADAVRIFLDCSYFCDNDFIRTEINYVNWVRDRADAQVHVIVSRLSTGGGGGAYTFTFTGRKNFQGREDTLTYNSRMTESEDQVRRGITQTLKLGLVPFIATTSGAQRLQISWAAATAENKTEEKKTVSDPWNYWVFSLSMNSNFNGEESQKFYRFGGNVSANRTTEAFKIRIGFNGNYNESSFTYDPGNGTGDTTVVSIRKGYSSRLLGVKSVGPHWSAGAQGEANSGTFGNIELGLEAGPALEYSFWPYAEATRRALVFQYTIGVRSFDYREITIFGKQKETHPAHWISSELDLKQRFGSIRFSAELSQYLHNTSYYNAEFFGEADLKLFKGFSLNFYTGYEKVRDQLAISAADLTPEDVLLQQKQQRTNYRYFGGFGIRYSFGSIFNNVVNPRFD
jgi:hypothetical protein